MKAILKSTVVIAFMFATVVSMAKEKKSYSLVTVKDENLIFRLENISEETTIKLLDSDSNVIYSEKLVGQSDYAKNFDFKNLESGVYFLKAENILTSTEYIINIKNDDVTIVDEKVINKPFFNRTEGKLYVTLLNESLENVDVIVYNVDGDLVFEETSKELKIQKIFNFEKAYGDKFTVLVKDNNSSYYNEFVIEK